MDNSALQTRLDEIERRQSLVLALIVVGYALAGTWFLVEAVDPITQWTAGAGWVVVVCIAMAVGVYRRRRAKP